MKKYGEFELVSEAGSGGCGEVFVAKKTNDVVKKAYILKTVNENSPHLESDILTLQNEIKILKELNEGINPNLCPHFPVLYASDENNYQKEEDNKYEKNKIQENDIMDARPYYVTDFFTKQSLYYYLIFMNDGFEEIHAKVIFKKIVETIKYCHDRKICHLDIKPGNIMLDNKFEPNIIDFGFSTKFRNDNDEIIKLNTTRGTQEYKCPEIWEEKELSGDKVDIFSLGVVLFNLVIGSLGFVTSEESDEYYNEIKQDTNGTYEKYWKKISVVINKVELSTDFKNLYIKMVAYNPKDRPTTDEILNSPWLDEINKKKNEDKESLDNEVKKILENIYKEKIINIKAKKENSSESDNSNSDKIILAEEIKLTGYITKSDNEGGNIFLKPNLKPKKISEERINLNLCIIIDGYLDGKEYMNFIFNKIKDYLDNDNEESEDEIRFNASEEDLKFRVIFEKDEKYHKNCVIDIELFEYKDNRHILEFLRKSGEISDYYKNYLLIKDIIKGKEIEQKNIKSIKNDLAL